MKPAVLLAFLAALPLSATTITVSPSTPKAGDSVVVTIHEPFGSFCPATVQSAHLQGQLLTIESVVTPAGCADACPAVVVPTSFSTAPVVLPDARPYTIEYAVTNCGGIRTVMATKQVLVRPQCAFDRSLTVTPGAESAVGNTVVFHWCDPSYSPFPDAGESATAYRVYLVREGDAPILVHQQAAKDGTSAAVKLAPSEAGATGAFVEADICDITIAGCRPSSTVLKSDIVPLRVSAADGCSFGGEALCLANRFSVTARFHTDAGSSPAHAVTMTNESGYFWFFGPQNAEVVVKMVDACSLSSRFWLFAAGMTDVGVDLVVRDAKTGAVRRYSNPAGKAFAPIQDTDAFPCP